MGTQITQCTNNRGNIGGVCRDNGKENGNYYLAFRIWSCALGKGEASRVYW